jgi:hypothetical protein
MRKAIISNRAIYKGKGAKGLFSILLKGQR